MNVVFQLDLPHGRCVGVEIPEVLPADALLALRLPEQRFAEHLTEARRASWVAGRIALRAALDDLGIAAGPLLATDRGAPLVPAEVLGSISHKRELAVGLAARRSGRFELGVDLERDAPLRIDISRRVLTEHEVAELAALAPEARHSEVLLRLSAKESIYKAIDPFVRRYVGFQEAAIAPHPDGSAGVALALVEGDFDAEVSWRRIEVASGGYFLTSARVAPRG
jgi:enterobactin synthetase component D / holo-[acyl-carrier protein] synthase